MGRKRKIPIVDEEKENAVSGGQDGAGAMPSKKSTHHGPMYTIMSNVQLCETNHKKYIKEMHDLYTKMDHDAFMFTFIKMIKTAMVAEEGNEYAETTLLFCAKFVSSYDGEDTHPVLYDMSKWLLTTISRNPQIRYRICQFVNMILKALGMEAALDDNICDRILEYMLNRLHDTSANVRLQAILAMQRLQVPDNPDDPVLRAYQYHLCSDPSPRVRQAVITCMGRNYHTIPYILERLWDIDEKVRRHTYLHMSSYPVRSYKVSQRLMLLQQGLNDRSESVRKVVVNIMLQQWIESYQKDIIALISALKLDSNEADIERFRKVVKQTLKEILKRQKKDDLLACLPVEMEGELHHCVPLDRLTMENALYWQCLTEYLQFEMAEEIDLILPELSTFCTYVQKFCETQKPDWDKFESMAFQYKLLSLLEILCNFDLGDEIGRVNLQKLLEYVLKKFRLEEKTIEAIVRCAENLITDQSSRLQFFVEIIQDIGCFNNKPSNILSDRTMINELLASTTNEDIKLKVTSLKVKILELEEQEMNFAERKDYMRAQQITDRKNVVTEELVNLLQSLLEQHPDAEKIKGLLQLCKPAKQETIVKGLTISFFMVVSDKVCTVDPIIYNLYGDFICRHIPSSQIAIRDWALKCGTACSMLYEAFAKDVFAELYAQFFKNHNIRIWETSIICIFELLDRYGLDNFAVEEEQNKTKKSGRQLYNSLEFLDSADESANVLNCGEGMSVIYMMSHFLGTCDDVCITSAITVGFCRLILRDYIKANDIMEKLLLSYFNPSTNSKVNQILGVFLENLIEQKKHGLLQVCLLPMLSTVLSAPYDNPLHDIRPETITRFIIDSTCQESSILCEGHIHNKMAISFLEEMLNNLTNKELCKLLAKELLTLELNVTQNLQMKNRLKELADRLIKCDFDPKTIKCIIDFKDLVDGNFNPMRKTIANGSEVDVESNDETECDAKDDDDTDTVTTARSTTTEKECNDNLPPTDTVATISCNTDQAESTSALPTVPTTTPVVQAINATPIANEAPPSVTSDSSIITKDISPSTRTPTTYGRENSIGQRYLRKSLNSTRGQSSDIEVGEGPHRSPKIRIEARIDSDKKTERPAEEQKVNNTRARRNLRYNATQEPATAEMVVEKTPSKRTKPVGSAKKAASARKQLPLPIETEGSTDNASINEKSTNKFATPSVPKNTRSPKRTANNVLNTPDFIPASPETALRTRTTLRRQRRAAGADGIDGATGRTRSHSAQPPKNSEDKNSTRNNLMESSAELTAERGTASKRAHQKTPEPQVEMELLAAAAKPTEGTTESSGEVSRNKSPQNKRLRIENTSEDVTPKNGIRVKRGSKAPATETKADVCRSRSARARERENNRRHTIPGKPEIDVESKSDSLKKPAPVNPNGEVAKNKSNESMNLVVSTRSRSNSLLSSKRKLGRNKKKEVGNTIARVTPKRRSRSQSGVTKRLRTPMKTNATPTKTRQSLPLLGENRKSTSASSKKRSKTAEKSHEARITKTAASVPLSKRRLQMQTMATATGRQNTALERNAKMKPPPDAESTARVRASKIPVRSGIMPKATTTTKHTSTMVKSLAKGIPSSTSGTDNSSNDEATKGLVPYAVRRRDLTSKMMLVQRSSVPVPKNVARFNTRIPGVSRK